LLHQQIQDVLAAHNVPVLCAFISKDEVTAMDMTSEGTESWRKLHCVSDSEAPDNLLEGKDFVPQDEKLVGGTQRTGVRASSQRARLTTISSVHQHLNIFSSFKISLSKGLTKTTLY
jgi:hypothetical protein